MAAIAIDIAVEAGDWPPEAELADKVERAVKAVAAEVGASGATEVSLLFTDDGHMAKLNQRWRGKAGPTNVLSFPSGMSAQDGRLPEVLGDIVLARETLARECALDGKPFEHHLMHLIVHGLLHLLGHDHEDDREGEAMEALEVRVLARLAIPDPYR